MIPCQSLAHTIAAGLFTENEEASVVYLLDESGNNLTDESGNYLVED